MNVVIVLVSGVAVATLRPGQFCCYEITRNAGAVGDLEPVLVLPGRQDLRQSYAGIDARRRSVAIFVNIFHLFRSRRI